MTLDVSLEPYENLTEEPMAEEDFADLDEISFWLGLAPLWAVVVWRRVDLEGMLRIECPWLAEEENALLLEALIDNAFPIEYAFVLEAEDARQT